MAVIGNSATQQAFTPAVDYFSGNGSTTAFTLSRPVASVAQVEAVIDNVVQNPSSAYTVSSNTITFTSAPLSGTNNIYVRYTSPITQVIAPGQGTVNTTALGNITNIASGNSSLTLQTGSSNTTAVTVDTSQNVGIGTTSPSSFYSEARNLVVGTGTGGQGISIYAGSASQSRLMFANGTAGSQAYNGFVQYDHSSNTLQFGTNGGTERMRIDSSGNVGIGTASPLSTAMLEVSRSTSVIPTATVTADNQVTGWRTRRTGGTYPYEYYMGIRENSTALDFYDNTANALRMRIGSNGQIYMATTSAVAPGGPSGQVNILNPNNDGNWALALQNNATTSSSGRGIGIKNNVDFNNSSSEFIFCIGATSPRFFVNSNGGVYNYSGNNVNLSDRREKTNFLPAKSYLNTICSIPVQTFNYIDQNKEEDDGLTLGVVAQDVQAVAPELVSESDWSAERDGSKMRLSIYQTDLQYALMKSIQELKALVDAQATEIAELKAKVGV